MAKKLCIECEIKRKDVFPVTQLVNKTIQYVCSYCWKKFDFSTYMKG